MDNKPRYVGPHVGKEPKHVTITLPDGRTCTGTLEWNDDDPYVWNGWVFTPADTSDPEWNEVSVRRTRTPDGR